MTDVTLTGIWKNNFRFQLDFTRQSMPSDALLSLDLKHPSCTNTSLGLRRFTVWKVETQKRGSKRDRMTEQNHVKLIRKSVLKRENLTS